MIKIVKFLAVCVFLNFLFFSKPLEAKKTPSVTEISKLPVLDGGRIKPFATFSAELLQLIYGKKTFNDQPSDLVVMTWFIAPDLWNEKKIVVVNHFGLKEALNLEIKTKYFSFKELLSNKRIDLVLKELAQMREKKEKLTPYFQAAQRLEAQLISFHALKAGALKVVPKKDSDDWLTIRELDGELKSKFENIVSNFASNFKDQDPGTSLALKTSVDEFISLARAENPESYLKQSLLEKELFFNKAKPFRKAWILYLIGALLSLIFWQTGWKFASVGMWFFMVFGFLVHSYGFYLRVMLTGRPPVSNMYETVVWVAWGAVLFSMYFGYAMKKAYIILAGSIVAILCMVVADNAPIILDPSLQPLEPVLRSNMWLTVHVLTIVLSYAPLFLSFMLGIFGLIQYAIEKNENSEKVRVYVQACYRNIQIGIVLLAAGTILGGVWADYSWGRFWGWDPKETWAFIALMGYLALLHGRLSGWVKNIGMLIGSVVAFNLIIMAWYGVNYVLGAGLHSYGFGAGGIVYVSSFCAINLIFCAYIFQLKYFRNAEKSVGK